MLLWEHYLGREKPWHTFSVDMEIVNCLGGKQPQVVGMWMKDLEPFPKQAKILEHRISKVKELAEQALLCLCQLSGDWAPAGPECLQGELMKMPALRQLAIFALVPGHWVITSGGGWAAHLWRLKSKGVMGNLPWLCELQYWQVWKTTWGSGRAGLTGFPDRSSTQAWLKTYLWVPMNDICIFLQKTFAIACNWQ